MEALVCTKPGSFEYKNIKTPVLKRGQAIIKIRRIGICGTDLHAYAGTQPYFTYPRVLGHELAADFIEADGTTAFTAGEALTIIPYFNCGNCIACKNNKPNCCEHLQVCGVHIDGAMSSYISVPSYSLVKSQGLSYEELALVEPLAIGAHGIRRANIQKDEWVLVNGAGPIGLGAIIFAQLAGAKVIVADINEQRLQFCKTNLKTEHIINASITDTHTRLKEITGGYMPTIVIDATGNLKAINEALNHVAHGGKLILIGLQKGNISFSHPEFHKREATLMSSRNATREDFDVVINSIKNKLIDPMLFITHRVKFHEVKDAFSKFTDPVENVIKAMVEL